MNPNRIIALEETKRKLEDQLWLRQLQEYSDSRRLSVHEMLQAWPAYTRRQAALALQFAAVVFYEAGRRSDGTYAWKGARYGFEGSQYLSFGS